MELQIEKQYRVLLGDDARVNIMLVGVGGTGSAPALSLCRHKGTPTWQGYDAARVKAEALKDRISDASLIDLNKTRSLYAA